MKSKHLTLKVFSLIVLNDLVDSIAQIFMKKGVLEVGIGSVNLANFSAFVGHGVLSGWVWMGILLTTLNFFLWLIILHRIDLSIAAPVGSTIYIFVPLMSIIFLHEQVGWVRWAGIGLILLGIHFVASSKKGQQETVAGHG